MLFWNGKVKFFTVSEVTNSPKVEFLKSQNCSIWKRKSKVLSFLKLQIYQKSYFLSLKIVQNCDFCSLKRKSKVFCHFWNLNIWRQRFTKIMNFFYIPEWCRILPSRLEQNLVQPTFWQLWWQKNEIGFPVKIWQFCQSKKVSFWRWKLRLPKSQKLGFLPESVSNLFLITRIISKRLWFVKIFWTHF